MSEFTDEQKMHQFMGIEMNIQTWNLLGKDDRNEQDDVRMLNFAQASLYHWRLSPKFEAVNEQRGRWMISHSFAVLGKGKEALENAQESMRLTELHDLKDFDLAYAYEAMARSHAASGNKNECNNWLKKAEKAGNLINRTEDKKIFEGDLNAEPWFECE